MNRLFHANLHRLWLNKAFWISVVFVICFEVLFAALIWREGMPMEIILFIVLLWIGIVSSIFYSLYLGTEYSDGTIRNKMIAGHKRSRIYLANLVIGIISISMMYGASVISGIIIGCLAFAPASNSIEVLAMASAIGWLVCISYSSIFTLVGMLSSSKAKTSITCILTAFALLFIGMLCFSLLNNLQDALTQFMFEINPIGQTIQIMSLNVSEPWKYMMYSLLLSSGLTSIGIYRFNKKDLA